MCEWFSIEQFRLQPWAKVKATAKWSYRYLLYCTHLLRRRENTWPHVPQTVLANANWNTNKTKHCTGKEKKHKKPPSGTQYGFKKSTHNLLKPFSQKLIVVPNVHAIQELIAPMLAEFSPMIGAACWTFSLRSLKESNAFPLWLYQLLRNRRIHWQRQVWDPPRPMSRS